MSYRQVLKATKKYVSNQKFRTYLQKVYRKNKNNLISISLMRDWIQLLKIISIQKQQAQELNQISLTRNLKLGFLKSDHFILNQNSENINKIINGENKQMKKIYNAYMYVQLYYLLGSSQYFSKFHGTLRKQTLKIIRSEKKQAVIDDELIIYLV